MTMFTGTKGVNTFIAVTLKRAIMVYRDTGMKVNRAYTPKNMLAKASEITGKKFKARDYTGAIDALQAWLDENGTANG